MAVVEPIEYRMDGTITRDSAPTYSFSPLDSINKERSFMKRVAGISLKRAGFTLLELLIVMAILIVVIGLLGTTVWSNYRKALIRTATVQIESKFNDALEMFFMDFGRYPTQEEGLYILANLTNPNPQPSSNVLIDRKSVV